MTLQFWIGVLVGAIAAGAAFATLVIRAAQARREPPPTGTDEWEPPVRGRMFW